MTDALDAAGRVCLNGAVTWYNWWQPQLLLRFSSVISHGLCQWPLVPVLVRNATLVVSEHVYV
jgi:hypothetical protein